MNTNIEQQNKGQILVIVLIVLMILGIAVVTVTNNVINDTQQSVNNAEYETLVAKAELNVLEIAENLAFNITSSQLESDVWTILEEYNRGQSSDGTDITYNCQSITGASFADPDAIFSYQCNYTLDSELTAGKERVGIQVEEIPYLRNIELGKDESVMFKIDPSVAYSDNYYATLAKDINGTQLTGSDNLAIEVAIDFQVTDIAGNSSYNTARGVYDFSNSMFGGANNYTIDLNDTGNGTFRISIVDSIAEMLAEYPQNYLDTGASIEPLGIRFKLVSDQTPIFLTVTADSYQNIAQTRGIKSTSGLLIQDSDNIFGPQAFVETNIPLFQPLMALDYIIRTESTL